MASSWLEVNLSMSLPWTSLCSLKMRPQRRFSTKTRVILGRAIDVGPDFALESLVGPASLRMHVGEEVELGVASDFGMAHEELGQLRIVVGHVFLIREQRWVPRYDGGECGAEAEELDEPGLGGCHIRVGGRWRVAAGFGCRARRRGLTRGSGGASGRLRVGDGQRGDQKN